MIFDLNQEVKKIKESVDEDDLGMILIHNGIVRGTAREDNGKVSAMKLSYDKSKLEKLIIDTYKDNKGIKRIIVWINEGELSVGDDIMYVITAGDRRINVLSPFEKLIAKIKSDIVTEQEITA